MKDTRAQHKHTYTKHKTKTKAQTRALTGEGSDDAALRESGAAPTKSLAEAAVTSRSHDALTCAAVTMRRGAVREKRLAT